MTKSPGPFEVSRDAALQSVGVRRHTRSRNHPEKLVANGSARFQKERSSRFRQAHAHSPHALSSTGENSDRLIGSNNSIMKSRHADLDEDELEPPERKYDCQNYETCLSLAAALDWKSFHCTNCDETVDEQLLWHAHKKLKANPALRKFCVLPLPRISSDSQE